MCGTVVVIPTQPHSTSIITIKTVQYLAKHKKMSQVETLKDILPTNLVQIGSVELCCVPA